MSNRPYTYANLADRHLAEGGALQVRPNTVAEFISGSKRFDVYLFDSIIMSVHADGSVAVSVRSDRRNTTKNRINDALIPLGWKIVNGEGKAVWMVRTIEPPYRSMAFVDNMVLTSIEKKEA